MNKIQASFFVIFLSGIIAFWLFLPASDFKAEGGKKSDYAVEEILVKFKDYKDPVELKLAASTDARELLDYYNNLPEVEYAEPNYKYRATILSSDSFIGEQWYLSKINATRAWDTVRESPNVIIAILDTGVQVSHPDLKSNIWINKKEIAGNNLDDDNNGFIDDVNGWDFVNNLPDPAPKFKPGFTEFGIHHGTFMAGLAAASGNNAAGIAGITWNAKIMPLKVLDDRQGGSTTKVIKAIDYAIANGANIINFSFSGTEYSRALDEAVKRAYDSGAILVAAGGNDNGTGKGDDLDITPIYPACLDGANGENRVIGVASTDNMDQKLNFSAYGHKCIDIAAPGISLFSTVVYSPTNQLDGSPFNKFYDGYWDGPSDSVPLVSGALALISAANPSLDRNEIVKILLDKSDNISRLNPNYLGQLGRGRLNVAAAVEFASQLLKNKTEKLIIAPLAGKSSLVKITDQDGKVAKEFYAYAANFKGGVNLTTGDVNGDGRQEIITAAGPGGGPHIRIFNVQGKLIGQFFAFKNNFHGGVNISTADVNHDGLDEIIAVQASAGDSEIKIFKASGQLLGSFYAYDSKFKGGLSLATGDVDGDGEDEIVTGLEAGRLPEVRIFKAIGVLQGQFLAYPKTFLGGVRVAIARSKVGPGQKRAQIITAPGAGGGPHVKLFDNKGNLLSHFFAYNGNFRGGVRLSKADVDKDGLDEIITAAGPGGAPHVRVFKADGAIVGSFYAYEENFNGGVSAGCLKIIK